MPPEPTRDDRLRAAFAEAGTVMGTARALGLGDKPTRKHLRRLGLIGKSPQSTPQSTPAEYKETHTADGTRIEFVSDKRIQTVEDALAFANVDRTRWRVHRFEITSWESVLKLKDGKAETPVRKHLWRVWLDLRPVMPLPLLAATDALFARMAEHAPDYPALVPRRPPARPHLLAVDIFDVHFGKLAWEPETGQNYDLKIAERVYRNAVEDLAGMAAHVEIDRVLLPIGNDFFHIDGLDNATTAGTPQDTDGRYPKIIEAGEKAVIEAIEYLAAIAPVDVILVPGNHDRISSYHLARTVAAWFRKCDRVTVDHSSRLRKYVRYGTTLLGFTHGNQEKRASLPVIMATERPADWAETTNREWHCGHLHQLKSMQTTPVDTHDGVTVRTLRSLAGTDAWHYGRGLVGGTRAAEAFLYDRDKGWVAHYNANVRE